MNTPKKTSEFQRPGTPSRIPVFSKPSKDMYKLRSRMLKSPSAANLQHTSPASCPPAVFDLNGRRIRTEVLQKDSSGAVSKESDTKNQTPNEETIDEPTDFGIKSSESENEPVQDPLDNGTKKVNKPMVINHQVELVNCSTEDGEGIFKRQKLEVSQSVFIFDYSFNGDGNDSTFSNCCEGENSGEGEALPKSGFSWVAFWNGLSLLMIVLMLAMLLLINVDRLMLVIRTRKLSIDEPIVWPVVPKERSFLEKMLSLFRRFWVELKDLIVLDELEDDVL